ncbi:MAG: DUF5301 domain-containing protein, partial [Bacteroidales bacterium]|nr:DUF5301 domain-containing protein [Bacteroidales bacterium]
MLDKLFISVLNMNLIGSYAIVFVLIARLLLKKTPKIFSYALWGIVLFRLLCPVSFESVLSLMPTGKAPIPQDIIYNTAPQISTGVGIIDNSINHMLPMQGNVVNSVNPIQIWLFIGTVIWIVGILAMLIYSIVAFVRLKRCLIAATPLKENIHLVDHISSPFVMGLFKSKIYLPSSLTDTEKDFIIAHEICHIRRFDHVTRLLGFAALAVHWFNPFVWVAFIVSGKDMEMSCDEAVMKKMNTDIRTEYSRSLLHFGAVKGMIHATPLAFGEGDTKNRVKNVLNYKKPAFWVVVVSIIAVVAIGMGLMANPKNNPILTPKNNEVTSISIEQINEGESLGVIETADKNQIETMLKALQNTNKTMQESVNDSPKRDDYFQININGSNPKIFYLYNDREQYFIEEPYAGIYKTSRETSVSIAKIYTAVPSDYKPAIMINDQIYWLSTDANPAAPAGNTWLFGQIKKVSPPSAPPSENFEAIGLDPSYVGKDFYISSDGNTLYLDSMAGEKTLQFVFEEAKTET